LQNLFAGGSTLYIETALRKAPAVLKEPSADGKSDGSLELTGHLGDVMKESARIALTVARNFLRSQSETNTYLESR
jgi:ATP-dependent Lon protease